MKKYTIVDRDSGEIVSVVAASSFADVLMNVPSGGELLKGDPPSWNHYRRAGAWIAKSGRPSSRHEWDVASKEWRDPRTPAQFAALARHQRDTLLQASDWTQGADAPLSSEQRAAWAAYRTTLRELPEQPGFPDSINWPDPPA